MTDPKTVRFGLLGAGLIAPFHAKAIQAADGCELVAVADLDTERASAIAGEYDCQAVPSLDDLLANNDIDVINILLPNHLHCRPTLASAHAGKHVLVEKPPAMSLAETRQMIEACELAKVKLGIVLNCRMRRAIQAMKKAVDDGRFGRLLQADAYVKWFRDVDYYKDGDWHSSRRSGAGVTVMQGFHYTDLLTYLAGPAAAVQARMTNLTHPRAQLEDTVNAFITYENGAQGLLVASTAMWPGSDVRIELNGENGTAVMVGERIETWRFKDEAADDASIPGIGRNAVTTGAGGPADFDFADHQAVIEGMAHAVRENDDPLITAPSAIPTLDLTLGMYKSARTGKEVQLPLEDETTVWEGGAE